MTDDSLVVLLDDAVAGTLDVDALIDRVHELASRAPDALSDAAAAPDIISLGRDLPAG